MSNSGKNLYQKAGVDVAKGDALVAWLQRDAKNETENPFGRLAEGIGGFAGLFRPDFSSLKTPLLVSSTDGVGTKLLLALEEDHLEGIGEDLVAMCVNDLYCMGATPLFFLDYFATGKLDDTQFKTVLTSIRSGLARCQTFLLGGETAEMPGLYSGKHFDLCGFVVGVVDEESQLGAPRVKKGDRLIAMASSGLHSNGYSLVRRWLEDFSLKNDQKLLTHLLKPTTIYSCIPHLLFDFGVTKLHALANITGGGISGNLNRVLPKHLDAFIERKKIQTPQWMQDFIAKCDASPRDVEGVFNLGVGMIAVVEASASTDFIAALQRANIHAYDIGEVIEQGSGRVRYDDESGS